MNNIEQQFRINLEKALKAYRILNSSIKKYVPFDIEKEYTDEELEQFDALSDRFIRATEMCIRLLKTWEIMSYGESSLTLRDSLNRAEKSELILSTSEWMQMRQIRNRIAHDYLPDEIGFYYQMINDKYIKQISYLIEKIKIMVL